MSRNRFLALAVTLAVPATSLIEAATHVRVVHHGPRTTVVVHRGFPLRRPLPRVVVVAPRVHVRVAPAVYLPAVVWSATVVAAPPAAQLSWEDSEELAKETGWTDLTLNADAHGRRLFIEVGPGSARLNFAEVVFANGDAQVVDFSEQVRPPGLYSLLDFANGRNVDHVRIVAEADSESARIALRLLK
jgi:hypothetical protein